MKIHDLSPAVGEKRDRKRLGRGIGSGLGKTSGKGHKGQNARSGGGVRLGFEGGQMPLIRRLPKRGFTNIFKKQFAIVNLETLNKFDDGTEVTLQLLVDTNIVKNVNNVYGLKILGNGELNKKLVVKAKAFTKSAKEAIVKAGGSVEEV